MLDTEQLKSELLQSERVGADRLALAEKAALDKGISLTEELASSLVLDFAELGECCAKITGLPYLALLPKPPCDLALNLMSSTCAAAWETLPVRYDAEDHRLWLAIHDPDQQGKLERIFRFFVQSQPLGFTVAPDVEIARACHKHLGVYSRKDRAPVPQARLKHESKSPVKPDAAEAKRKAEGRASDKAKRKADKKRVEPSYEQMHRCLLNMVTLLVRREYLDRPEVIHEIRTRVRYCQLLAARRNLNRLEIDSLVLAAWVVDLGDALSISKQVATPYALDAIMFPDNEPEAANQKHRVQAEILSLVREHEKLRKQGESQSRDVSKVRRSLQLNWSAAPNVQDLLESFLQILVDDEFLEKMGGSDGRVLILDPEEESTGALVSSLVRLGYNAVAVSDEQAAVDRIPVFSPDLVIIEMSHSPTTALRFCESLSGPKGGASVPVLALVPEGNDALASQCLRAGAFDFLRSPVNMELLLLKIQSCLAGEGADVNGAGVTGTLDEMSFTDMIQILCAGRKDLEITVRHEDAVGHVYVSGGEVIHASLGDLKGEDAFYGLMKWQRGQFSTHRCTAFPDRSITGSTMSLLMEGARQVDEQENVPD